MTDTDTIEYRTRELAKARPLLELPDVQAQFKANGPQGDSEWLNVTPAEYSRVVEALTTDPGITYRVQPHDINTLTWPMWEACGIECPKMIGAPCQHPNGNCSRFGKFPNAATEVVYGWTMESFQSDTCGDVDQLIGCNHLFRAAGEDDDTDGPMGAGLILHTDSQGFVTLTRYATVLGLESDWQQLQEKEAEYERANCENCAELNVPCDDHSED